MAPLAAGQWNVVLVGASTLRGKEIKSVLEERRFPLRRLALIDAEEARGQLTEFDGEPVLVQPVDADAFRGVDLAIFASHSSFTATHWRSAAEAGCRIVDLSYGLESESQARLCAPLVAPLWESPGGDPAREPEIGFVAVSAHPVALVMSGILALLGRVSSVVRAAATLCAPVSEHGQAGVEELHRQTVSLLSFRELPQAVFDAQVAFNVLSRCGEQSQPTLHQQQERAQGHLKILLDGRAVQPALRLLQAPVFHGYSFTCWLELAQPASAARIEAALDQKPFSVCRNCKSQPDVVAAASSDEILLGSIERDPAREAGYWIWGVFDNLRIAACNAEQIAREMLRHATGPAPVEPGGWPA